MPSSPARKRSPETAPKQAKEVLSYFLRNPQAADTLEGVARWRLLDEPVHRSVEEINQALEWLVAQGFLVTGESCVPAAPNLPSNRRGSTAPTNQVRSSNAPAC
jgi:hypothetical protein